MSIYINGWTRESILKQIEEKNGFLPSKDHQSIDYYYRHPITKLPCLIGAFIPDKDYNLAFEKSTPEP